MAVRFNVGPVLLGLCLVGCLPATCSAAAEGTDESGPVSQRIEGAVVKVFSSVRYPDPGKPWTRQPPSEVTGSGVVIESKRILTNAHVVSYAGQIQVQGSHEGDKLPASIVAIAPAMDLAVLKVDDESFFERHAPLERSKTLPHLKDSVLVHGFPVGGTSLSITKGIVSRIEFASYSPRGAGLRVQIDAALNPGNSGGPATVGDKMVGLAFSFLGNTQNIGYIIPVEEIEIFLNDIEDGHYDGKPAILDEYQTLETAALRSYLKLGPDVHGVVVHKPFRTDPDYPLHQWDVITHIAGVPIDDQGMIQVEGDLRIQLRYQVQRSARDGRIRLKVVREGRSRELDLPLAVKRDVLVPSITLDPSYPSYFIYGPLVFSRASAELVRQAAQQAKDTAAGVSLPPLLMGLLEPPSAEREELVIIPAPFFPHATVTGYSSELYSVIHSINGVRVHSLKHLVELLRDLRDKFLVIEVERQRGGESLVFRRAELAAATEEILSDNGVRAQGSPDMMEVWRANRGADEAAPPKAGR